MTWKRKVFLHRQENYLPEGKVANQFDKITSAFNIFEQIINPDVSVEILNTCLKK